MPEIMKPDPPTICGTQYMPSKRPCDNLLLMPGRAVKPDIWLYIVSLYISIVIEE